MVELEAIDVLDKTPLVDIKPYFASTDSIPDAVRTDREATGLIGRTGRTKALAKALTVLLPTGTLCRHRSDPRYRLSPQDARTPAVDRRSGSATVTHVRHVHTEYDALLSEGYGPRTRRAISWSTRSTRF